MGSVLACPWDGSESVRCSGPWIWPASYAATQWWHEIIGRVQVVIPLDGKQENSIWNWFCITSTILTYCVLILMVMGRGWAAERKCSACPKHCLVSSVAVNLESKRRNLWMNVHLWIPPLLEKQGGRNWKLFLCCFKVVVITNRRNALQRLQKYAACILSCQGFCSHEYKIVDLRTEGPWGQCPISDCYQYATSQPLKVEQRLHYILFSKI